MLHKDLDGYHGERTFIEWDTEQAPISSFHSICLSLVKKSKVQIREQVDLREWSVLIRAVAIKDDSRETVLRWLEGVFHVLMLSRCHRPTEVRQRNELGWKRQ